jgi:hypothetical protein
MLPMPMPMPFETDARAAPFPSLRCGKSYGTMKKAADTCVQRLSERPRCGNPRQSCP